MQIIIGLIVAGALTITGCISSQHREKFAHGPEAISVMAYNLENLFDDQHDAGTEDYTYLPLKLKESSEHKAECEKLRSQRYKRECLEVDWSKTVIELKMYRLADAILQVNNGRGPDILIVEEVENQRVLEWFNREYLKAAGYKTVVVLEGFDKRGIDIGLLSRIPLAEPAKLHRIAFNPKTEEEKEWMGRTRGILQGVFKLSDGTKLNVFGVHFPSPANPTHWRLQAIAFLNDLVKKIPKNELVIAGGDFNISSEEDAKRKMYDNFSEQWVVSHRIGCKDCRGTNYWHTGRSWSFLDALLFRKEMAKDGGQLPWYVDASSIGIPKYSVFQTNRFMSPARFNETDSVGVSDHWPIYAVIRPRSTGEKTVGKVE